MKNAMECPKHWLFKVYFMYNNANQDMDREREIKCYLG